MTSATESLDLLVNVGGVDFEVEFSGSTYEELLEAIKNEVTSDCLPPDQEIARLEIFKPKWDKYVHLDKKKIGTVKDGSLLKAFLKPIVSGAPAAVSSKNTPSSEVPKTPAEEPKIKSTDCDQKPTEPSTDVDQKPTKPGTTSTDGNGEPGTASDQEPEKFSLCSSAPDIEQEGGTSGTPTGAQAASVSKKKVWGGRQQLKVYFMNPDDIDEWGWRCRGEPMNKNTILAWARVWNFSGFPMIPLFENFDLAKNADIRVQFSDKGQNWSMVGMEATVVTDLKQPTMVLSLGGHSPDLQESLVVHEFGHALGLEHEHQRSDFWDVLGEHLDIDKMKMDCRVNPTKDPKEADRLFKKNWGGLDHDGGKSKSSPYDPESIMHYWFDIKWIKKVTLQTYEKIDKDSDLKEDAKRYLKGIHERSKKGELTKRPSLKDYKALVEAYGGDFEESEELMQVLKAPDRVKGGATLNVNKHIKPIRNVVWEMRADWRRLGVELDISTGTLDAIEVDKRDVGDKLGAVLEKWMHTGKATTSDLVSALKAAPVGRFDLANKVSNLA